MEIFKEIESIANKSNIFLMYTPVGIKDEAISFTPEIIEFYDNNTNFKYITRTVIKGCIPKFYNITDCLIYGLNHLKSYLNYNNK